MMSGPVSRSASKSTVGRTTEGSSPAGSVSVLSVFRRFGLLRQFYMGSDVLIGPGALGILVKVAYHQKPAAKCQQPAEGNHRNTNNFSLWGISAVLALFEIGCGKQPAADHSQRQEPAIQENEIVIPGLRYRFIRLDGVDGLDGVFGIIRVIRGSRFLWLFIEDWTVAVSSALISTVAASGMI